MIANIFPEHLKFEYRLIILVIFQINIMVLSNGNYYVNVDQVRGQIMNRVDQSR